MSLTRTTMFVQYTISRKIIIDRSAKFDSESS
jgi:hypothetical protein